MKSLLVAFLVPVAAVWTDAGWAQMTPVQVQQAETFAANVRALDPHTKDSEPGFQELARKYVPATGPVQTFLDFMMASGFACPPASSLSDEIDRELPIYRCTFHPDLGATAEPSLSSVTETSVFGVAAHCDQNRNIMAIEGYMTHGFIGP